MNILIASSHPERILPIVNGADTVVFVIESRINEKYLADNNIEMIISYGYRHIIKKSIIEYVKGNIINLHISYLPWNRGADPNLWSFLENSPKGVTIHYIDEGIDTGDIITQKKIDFSSSCNTLKKTYNMLHDEMISLFNSVWLDIKAGNNARVVQKHGGSFHKLLDKEKYSYLLADKSWDTDISTLKGKAVAHKTRE
jgi:methionyl-tRNA formyltransferase